MSEQRVNAVMADLLRAVVEVVEKHQITHAEYRQVVDFLESTGKANEIPLLFDVFVESFVVDANSRSRRGTPVNVLGPFYLPDAPWVEDGHLATDTEGGDRLVVSGTVRDFAGEPLSGAVLEFWQCDAKGRYSNFNPGPPDMNLRGRLRSEKDGSYEVHTVRPAPYTIPHEGPTGLLLKALGRHPWRPAHLHLIAGHGGYQSLTTQIYFEGDEYLDSDAANAARSDLVYAVSKDQLEFDVVLEPTQL